MPAVTLTVEPAEIMVAGNAAAPVKLAFLLRVRYHGTQAANVAGIDAPKGLEMCSRWRLWISGRPAIALVRYDHAAAGYKIWAGAVRCIHKAGDETFP